MPRNFASVVLMLRYLEHFIGRPYLWGGDDPMGGFDCSGLAVEGLQAVGIIPRGSDFAAGSLFAKFPKTTTPLPGCLVYWGDEAGKVQHVEIVFAVHADGLVLTVGASGGGVQDGQRSSGHRCECVRENPAGQRTRSACTVPRLQRPLRRIGGG